MAPMVSSEIFLVLADGGRNRGFAGGGGVGAACLLERKPRAWISATLVLLTVGGAVLVFWGPWPSAKTLFAGSTLGCPAPDAVRRAKSDMLANLLVVQLGVLVVLFGRRFHAGWRSHAQQIVIGLSTAAIAQLAVRGIWQAIALHTTIHSQANTSASWPCEEKFINADSVVFLAVLVWWIACLWFDEPGRRPLQLTEAAAATAEAKRQAEASADAVESCVAFPKTAGTDNSTTEN